MRWILLALAAAVVTPAMAQQPSPSEQAFGVKLLKEMQEGLTCSANLISTQADLAKAQERIKELEAKLPKEEPKKE